MIDDHAAGAAVARHDVDDARRHARLAAEVGEQERGERRVLGGLQHHRVARGQRRSDFPGGHQQRIVPGYDAGHHPPGLFDHEIELNGIAWGDHQAAVVASE